MNLNRIQSSQLFISSEKLARVLRELDWSEIESLEPVPVKRLGSQVVFTDGHTRAFAAASQDLAKIRVFWDEDELDWESYEICVQWCTDVGVRTIRDLTDRVVPAEEYEILWLDRCRQMHEDLEKRRNRIGDGRG